MNVLAASRRVRTRDMVHAQESQNSDAKSWCFEDAGTVIHGADLYIVNRHLVAVVALP